MSYIGTEDLIADAWIKATLAADTGAGGASTLVGGRLSEAPGPRGGGNNAGSGYPRIVWQQLSPLLAFNGLGAQFIYGDVLYLIKAVGQTESYSDLRAMAQRIYLLFHDQETTITGGRILASVRERAFRQSELTDGVSYRHLGHVFRIAVQPTDQP